MTRNLIAGVMLICCLAGCADREPDHDSSLGGTNAATPANTTVADSQTAVSNNTQAGLPVAAQPMGQATIAPLPQAITNAVATGVTAPGMNPPHGQPNHRCDIEVGAPLNSPASKPAAQTVQTVTPSPVSAPAATTAKVSTPAGMNPPHGEPNHRCDIAVGAPLNSAATKPAAQTITPMTVPVTKDSSR